MNMKKCSAVQKLRFKDKYQSMHNAYQAILQARALAIHDDDSFSIQSS